ncbi:Mom family adenine methylcarbamoylation protein [Asanoa siamensis]|uniref:Uncharacterized protein n=3 Tax=Asanoa TaxID=195964 RepID=A0A239PH16_9ACTN|nr:hypothetical protein [Asanoa siamensis]GIF74153.1 hypothetical protein Asi02nite_36710 [Asanoa siamensis]SNT65669.1 hypothetical protein SAMN05421812_12512 [Asanoa hainanensis]
MPAWSYADPSERFSPRGYEVQPIAEAVAKPFVTSRHYLRSYPAAVHQFGLFRHGELIGVAVYGNPAQDKVLTNPLPDLEPYTQSLVLQRLVLGPTEGNAETWTLGQCRALLLDEGLHAVITFADPAWGHVGIIYQAFNCIYLGTSKTTTTIWLPDGTCLDERTMQKIRAQERGHAAAERRLVSFGARPMRAGEKPHEWLRQALLDVKVTRRRTPGKHRYAMPLRKDVKVYKRDRNGRAVRAHRDPSRYPKPSPDLFAAMGVPL